MLCAGKAVAEKTGCSLGDEDCLRKWGVWPGQVSQWSLFSGVVLTGTCMGGRCMQGDLSICVGNRCGVFGGSI